MQAIAQVIPSLFQFTYLYKVRPNDVGYITGINKFQFTYLDKVRLTANVPSCRCFCFNSRTYIRYDLGAFILLPSPIGFNSRTYIRYDVGVAKYTNQR